MRTLAALCLITLSLGSAALGQDAAGDNNDALAAARTELENARRAVQDAAREVARLSAEHVNALGNYVYADRIGRLRRPLLGINIENADVGVRVVGVTPNGAASRAGIVTGDLIVAVDGIELEGSDRGSPSATLLDHLAEVEPGDIVELSTLRDSGTIVIPVTTSSAEMRFSAWLDNLQNLEPLYRGLMPLRPGAAVWRDMELVELTPGLGAYFGATEGLLVVRAPSRDGLELVDGDVILTIGGRTPTSIEHAMRILASFEPGEQLELEIMREQRRRTVRVELPPRNG